MELGAKSAKVEAARRARARRKRNPFDLRAVRLRDLNRILDSRYRGCLPDTDEGRKVSVIMAHHLAMLPIDPRRRLLEWLKAAAPWYTLAEADALLAATLPNPKMYKASTLGWLLKVRPDERAALRLTTIGAVGENAADRRKERAKLRKTAERWANGAKTRAEYEAKSLTKLKPWTLQGISRRTWYRRKAA